MVDSPPAVEEASPASKSPVPAAPAPAAEVVPSEAPTKLQLKVAALWAAMPKNEQGTVERLACWAVLLADAELAQLVDKNGDGAKVHSRVVSC